MSESRVDRPLPRSSVGPRAHSYEVNAFLKVSEECEQRITDFFLEQFRLRPGRVQSNMHLTVYHGRKRLPGLREMSVPVNILVDTTETRFMVLAPGGENPRDELDPGSLSVGIRLTKRNPAVADIQRLRENVYRFETRTATGSRRPTTAWTNAFGSRHYQPHIQVLKPWSKIQRNLTEVSELFRSKIRTISLDVFSVESRNRVDGGWVVEG